LEDNAPGLSEWELKTAYRTGMFCEIPKLAAKLVKLARVDSESLSELLSTPELVALRSMGVVVGWFSMEPADLALLAECIRTRVAVDSPDGLQQSRALKLVIARTSSLGSERDAAECEFWKELAAEINGIECRF
jgi:hypothetical protein